MAKSLNLLLKAKLNEKTSLSDIKGQISKIGTELSKNPIKLNIDIKDLEKVAKQFTKLQKDYAQAVQKINQSTGQGKQTKNRYNDLQKEIAQMRTLGNTVDKVVKNIDSTTQELTGATVQYKNKLGDVVKETYQWGNVFDKTTGRMEQVFKKLNTQKSTNYGQNTKQVQKDYEQLLNTLNRYENRMLNIRQNIDKDIQSPAHLKLMNQEYDKIIAKINDLKQNHSSLTQEQKREVTKQINDLNRLNKAFKEQAKSTNVNANLKDYKEISSSLVKLKNHQEAYNKSILQGHKLIQASVKETKNQVQVTQELQKGNNITKLTVGYDKLTGKAYELNRSIKDNLHDTNTWSKSLTTATKRMAQWLTAGTLLFQSVRFFTEGIAYVNELNRSLTEIAIVTNSTTSQMKGLGLEYTKLAKEMGALTEEVAKGALEFYRQGLSQAEVMERMQVATMGAKISAMDFKTTAELLTAATNSMNVEIERASDVFSYLGDSTATSYEEIATGFQKVGGSAGALGVEFEKVASWIATVSARTRESAETIGSSFNTIITRMSKLTAKGFDEEDGTRVNDVAKALKKVADINLTDAHGEFRDFGVVVDELGGKWEGLSKREKAYVATMIAGTRQQSRFLNLMEGYKDSISLYEGALDSAGTTQEKYNIYLQGTEAHINRLKATGTEVWQKVFDSETIVNFIDVLNSMLNGFGSLIDTIGFLPTIAGVAMASLGAFSNKMAFFTVNTKTSLKSWEHFKYSLQKGELFGGVLGKGIGNLVVGMKKFQTQTNASIFSTQGLSIALQALFGKTMMEVVAMGALKVATMGLNLVMGAFLGIIAGKLMEGLMKLINRKEELKRKNFELVQSYKQQQDEINKTINSVNNLNKEYTDLNNKKTSIGLNIEEQAKYNDLLQEIGRTLPETVSGYDSMGNAIVNVGDNLDYYIQKLEETKRLQQEGMVVNSGDTFDSIKDSSKDNIKELQNLQQEFGRLERTQKDYENAVEGLSKKNSAVSKERYNFFKIELDKTIKKKKDLSTQIELETNKIKDNAQGYKIVTQAMVEQNDMLDEINPKLQSLVANTAFDSFEWGGDKDNKDFEEHLKNVSILFGELSKIDTTPSQQQLEQLKQRASDLNIPLSLLTTLLNKLGLIDAQGLDDVTQKAMSLEDAQKMLISTYDETYDKVKEVAEVLENYKKEGEFSEKQIISLAKSYPQLLSVLNDEKGMEQELINIKHDRVNASLESLEIELSATAQFLEDVSGIRAEDLKSYADYQEAKVLIAQTSSKAINSLAHRLPEPQAYAQQLGDGSVTDLLSSAMGGQSIEVANKQREASEQLDKYYQIQGAIDRIKNLSTKSFSKPTAKKSKKSSSSKSEFKAEIDILQAYENAIEDVNNALALNKQLQDQTSDKWDLIRLQKEEVALLERKEQSLNNLYNQQQALANQLATKIQSSGFVIDNGEITNYKEQLERLGQSVNSLKEGDTKSKRIESLKQLQEDTQTYLDLVHKEMPKVTQEINDVVKEVNNIRFDKINYTLDSFGNEIEELNKYLTILKSTNKDYKEDSEEHVQVLTQEIDLYKKQQFVLVRQSNYIKQQLALTSLTIAQQEQLKNKLKEVTNAYYQLSDSIFDTTQSIKKMKEDMADEIIDLYKDMYEEEKKLALEKIDLEIDALDKRREKEEDLHDKVMDNYDEEIKKLEELYNSKIKELDKEVSEKKYQEQVDALQKEARDIQKIISSLAMDNSGEGRVRKEALEKQLSQKLKEIEDLRYDHTMELRKENLQDELEAKKEELEENKKTEQEKSDQNKDSYDYKKELLEKEKQAVEKHYNALINDEIRFSEMKKKIMDGELKDVIKGLEHFKNKFDDNLDIIGKSITENLISKIDKAIDKMKELSRETSQINGIEIAWDTYLENKRKAEQEFEKTGSWNQDLARENEDLRNKYGFEDGSYDNLKNNSPAYQGGGSYSGSSSSSSSYNPLGMSSSDFKDYVENKRDWELGIDKERAGRKNQKLRDKYGVSSDRFSYEELLMYVQGSYRNGGLITDNHLAMVHGTEQDWEAVLNKPQLQELMHRTIANTMSGLSRIAPSVFSGTNTTNSQQVTLTFDSLVKVEGDVTGDSVSDMEDLAKHSIDLLNQELKKQGVI